MQPAEPPPPADVLKLWADRLESAAAPGLAPTPPEHSDLARRSWVDSFTDERGNRPDIVTPFLTWRTGFRTLNAPADGPSDVMLWWALLDPRVDASRFIRMGDDGPVVRQDERLGIEAWTERELRGLHALWHLARERGRSDWRARCLAATRRLVAESHRDSTTNHPWAVHVFVVSAVEGACAEADLYAQTLLHNCGAYLGRTDRLSAYILLDAAAGLRAEAVERARR